ncbi:MAG: tetratricopeptide repeat protein [Streptosporangiaceae bacterium]|jgi:tetratricopeptide (TPR) repeat protein
MSDFMGMAARARARTGDKDWAAAADLWASVSAANPVNGDYWARLGEARFGAHDYPGAREAYEKALRLGVRETEPSSDDTPPLMPGEIAYRIACCEAAAGDREAAVAALRVALDRGGARSGPRPSSTRPPPNSAARSPALPTRRSWSA